MRVWRMSLRRTKNTIISWRGTFSYLTLVLRWCRRRAAIFHWDTPWRYEPPYDKTSKMTARPAKTQISLGIHTVWSEPSLCAQWVAKDKRFLHADSEDSDQTGWMPRLIWVFLGRTDHFLCFVMRRLIFCFYYLLKIVNHFAGSSGQCVGDKMSFCRQAHPSLCSHPSHYFVCCESCARQSQSQLRPYYRRYNRQFHRRYNRRYWWHGK